MILLTMCKFNHKFTEAISLSQMFTAFILLNKSESKWFVFTMILLNFKDTKKSLLFFISPPEFFVLYLFTRYEGQKPKPSLPWICLWGRPATSRISGHVIIFCTKESSSSSKPGPNIAKRGSAWVTSDCKKEVTAPYRGRLDFKLLLPWGQLLLYLCKIDATRN